ncbi:glutathione transferase GstA [Novosphingobium kaempferiae]|uniref:glutathione transferase GstA n=1 Tax=Novosphingobium kaempferiae TaxID=2896849 RepID=UPI001E4B2C7D|nr:glutathione transferase GstA [Novosphingobium kaempferiae]
MKLYYAPGACSLADHIAIVEAGLPFTPEKVDLKEKRTETDSDYTTINPKGYVPALALDDGSILTENIAILSYLADRSEKIAASPGDRWKMLETIAFISTEVHKGFKPFFMPDSSDEAKKAAGDNLARRFAYLEAQLAERDYIVGDTFTTADCYLFVMLMWAQKKARLPLPNALTRYFDQLTQRPSIRQALSEEGLD